MFRWAVTSVLVTISWACAAAAQSDSSIERHRQAVASTHARLTELIALVYNDSVQRAGLPVVRTYGGMMLRADTSAIPFDFMESLDEAFAATLKDAVAVFGARAHGMLSNLKVIVARGASGDPVHTRGQSRYVTMEIAPVGGNGGWKQTADGVDPNELLLRRVAEQWFMAAMMDAAPPALRQWTSHRPTLAPAPRVDEAAYRDVRRAYLNSARACLAGTIRSCRSLLAIEPGNDTTISWLDADERRSTVLRFHVNYWRRPSSEGDPAVARDRCVNEGDDAACREALRLIHFASPISTKLRSDVLRLALEIGGPDAFERIRNTSSEEIGTLLESAAGIPVDSLVARWREYMLAGKPQSPAPNNRELAVSFAIIIAVLGLSAGRRP